MGKLWNDFRALKFLHSTAGGGLPDKDFGVRRKLAATPAWPRCVLLKWRLYLALEMGAAILILDDCEDLLLVMATFARRLCHREVLVAKSLSDLERLGDQVLSCGLAILDINLGADQPSGIEVYHWLRTKGFQNPIYFLTGHARNFPSVAEAERLGGARVFSKPLGPEFFAKIVRGLDVSQ